MVVTVLAALVGVALALVSLRIALQPGAEGVVRAAAACAAGGVILLAGALFLLPATDSPPLLLLAGVGLVACSILLGIVHFGTATRRRIGGRSGR
jgi:hypothetical protein